MQGTSRQAETPPQRTSSSRSSHPTPRRGRVAPSRREDVAVPDHMRVFKLADNAPLPPQFDALDADEKEFILLMLNPPKLPAEEFENEDEVKDYIRTVTATEDIATVQEFLGDWLYLQAKPDPNRLAQGETAFSTQFVAEHTDRKLKAFSRKLKAFSMDGYGSNDGGYVVWQWCCLMFRANVSFAKTDRKVDAVWGVPHTLAEACRAALDSLRDLATPVYGACVMPSLVMEVKRLGKGNDRYLTTF